MANQRRRANMRGRMAAAGQSWRSHVGGDTSYISLSQIEDVNDRDFLYIIVRSAARNAINEKKAMNIPVTIVENGWVVRKTAEGITERIEEIAVNNSKREKALTKGSVWHVKTRQ